MKTHYQYLRAIYNTQTKTYFDLRCTNDKIDIHTPGADPEILERGGALCRPPWLAGKKKF